MPTPEEIARAKEILRQAGDEAARTGEVRQPVGPLKYFRLKEKVGPTECHGRVYFAGEVIATDADLFNSSAKDKVEPATEEEYRSQEESRGNTTPAGGSSAPPVASRSEGEPTGGVQEPVPAAISSRKGFDTLNVMSVAELKKLATDEEIDLKGAKDKPAMIKAILDATGA